MKQDSILGDDTPQMASENNQRIAILQETILLQNERLEKCQQEKKQAHEKNVKLTKALFEAQQQLDVSNKKVKAQSNKLKQMKKVIKKEKKSKNVLKQLSHQALEKIDTFVNNKNKHRMVLRVPIEYEKESLKSDLESELCEVGLKEDFSLRKISQSKSSSMMEVMFKNQEATKTLVSRTKEIDGYAQIKDLRSHTTTVTRAKKKILGVIGKTLTDPNGDFTACVPLHTSTPVLYTQESPKHKRKKLSYQFAIGLYGHLVPKEIVTEAYEMLKCGALMKEINLLLPKP